MHISPAHLTFVTHLYIFVLDLKLLPPVCPKQSSGNFRTKRQIKQHVQAVYKRNRTIGATATVLFLLFCIFSFPLLPPLQPLLCTSALLPLTSSSGTPPIWTYLTIV